MLDEIVALRRTQANEQGSIVRSLQKEMWPRFATSIEGLMSTALAPYCRRQEFLDKVCQHAAQLKAADDYLSRLSDSLSERVTRARYDVDLSATIESIDKAASAAARQLQAEVARLVPTDRYEKKVADLEALVKAQRKKAVATGRSEL